MVHSPRQMNLASVRAAGVDVEAETPAATVGRGRENFSPEGPGPAV